MRYNVKITLYTTEAGRGCRTFLKTIDANSKEDACSMVEQMLEGFLADSVTMKTEVVI